MKILIINGPNLNLLGKREPEVYGSQSFEDFYETLKQLHPDCQLDYFQSNVEGELINKIQQADSTYNSIVLNGAGYTHTSVALADAIAAINTPVVEVHISNIYKREEYRHVSLTGKNCLGVITGFGLDGYKMAIDYLKRKEAK